MLHENEIFMLKTIVMAEAVNKLILGDNLEILKKMESDMVDLIYLDPHIELRL